MPQLAEAWTAACLHQRRVAVGGQDDEEGEKEEEGMMGGRGNDAPAAPMMLSFHGFLDLLGR